MKTKHEPLAAVVAFTIGLYSLASASDLNNEKYIYDPSGNILEKNFGDQVTRFNYSNNQLTEIFSKSTNKQYAYDLSGRCTSESESGKLLRKMEYQYLDKVTKVQIADKSTEVFYNAEGHIVATQSSDSYKCYAWDGLAIACRGEEALVNESHEVGGVAAIAGDDVVVSDMIGTSLSLGNQSFESTAYGENLHEGFFTGKPFIPELESFAFKFRNYSPERLRWYSGDPSGYPDGKNNFLFACQSPHQSYDREGLEQKWFANWTQTVDSAESNESVSYDVTIHYNPTQPLHREWDDNPVHEMRQSGASATLTGNDSFVWGTSHSDALTMSGAIQLWKTITLGAQTAVTQTGIVTGTYAHPNDGKTYMVKPTREELTFNCTKKTYGYTTTTYPTVPPPYGGLPVTTYSSVSPPQNSTGPVYIAYLAHGGKDLYEQ